MQKARRHTFPLRGIVLRPLVSAWFQVHIPPLAGVLLIFQSPEPLNVPPAGKPVSVAGGADKI